MKKALSIISVIALLLSLMLLSSCSTNTPGDAQVTEKEVSEYIEGERTFWSSNALEERDVTTYTFLELFNDDYDEILAATSVKDVSSNAFALFGYCDAHFEEKTKGKFIANKGWKAIAYLYQNDHENYKKWMQEVKATVDSILKTNTTTPSVTKDDISSEQTSMPLVAEDEFASIWFSGCEKKEFFPEIYVCFVVQNKTDHQLEVGNDSLAVNGWSLTDASVYERIAPNTKAIIKVETAQLDSLQVNSISGTLKLSDKSKELWGDYYRYYQLSYSKS